jgi:hypothetical protein
MSWQHALELMALGVILVCGVALYVEEVRERRKFMPYSKINQLKPGAFMVGKALK